MQTDGAGNAILGSSGGGSGVDIASLLLKALTGQSGSEDSAGSKSSTGTNQSQMIQDLLSQLTGKSSTSGSSSSNQVTDALQTAIQNATQQQNTQQQSAQNQTGAQTNQQTGTQAQNTTGSQNSQSTQTQDTTQLMDQIQKTLQSQTTAQTTAQNQVQNQVQQNNTGSVTTTGSNISAQGMQRLIDQALGAAGGVADIATGAHATGIYNSTTQQQLTNDLITRTAGELAARQAGTTSTTQNSGAITTTGNVGTTGVQTGNSQTAGSSENTGTNKTTGTVGTTGSQQNSQQSTSTTDMLNKLLSSMQTQGNVATAVTGQSSQSGSTQNTGSVATTGVQNQTTDTSQTTAQKNNTNQTGTQTGTDATAANTVRKADSPISNIDWGSLLGVGAAGVGASVLGPALGQLLGSLPGANGATGSSAIGNIGASLAQWLKGQGIGSGAGDITVDTSGAGNQEGVGGGSVLPDTLRGGGMGDTGSVTPDNQSIAPIQDDVFSGINTGTANTDLNGNWWEQTPDDWFNFGD